MWSESNAEMIEVIWFFGIKSETSKSSAVDRIVMKIYAEPMNSVKSLKYIKQSNGQFCLNIVFVYNFEPFNSAILMYTVLHQ